MNLKKNKLTVLTVLLGASIFSQNVSAQRNWQNLDLKKDSLFGISTEKAYTDLLKGKTCLKVIVAVIDCGIDTGHEDLKANIWSAPLTGIHGWNYLSGETGQEDVTHLFSKDQALYDKMVYMAVSSSQQAAYTAHGDIMPAMQGKIAAMHRFVDELENVQQVMKTITNAIGKSNPLLSDFQAYQPDGEAQATILKRVIRRMKFYPDWNAYQAAEITSLIDKANYHLQHGLNQNNTEPDTAKGNSDVSPDKLGPFADPNDSPYHGSHVAGIIGAVRDNNIGMNGVAGNAQLMMLKVMGNIREMKDRNLALAIRFAADHGAKIINMSLCKHYTWDKKAVDEAVKYAMKKDVLIVHAAGNDSQDNDHQPNYPTPFYANGRSKAAAWLEVGASDKRNDSTLVANFSNYGKYTVDVFAPGVDIYSTYPYNQYGFNSGTSMAAPVVAGLATLIRGYYPKLTAVEVKGIIMCSVVKVDHDVMVNRQKVPFSELCVSGGIVNAYQALQLAEHYK